MDLLQHTTFDEVRSLLGVSRRELADEIIGLPHWTLQIEQDLLDIDGGAGAVLTQFGTVSTITPETSWTSAQQQFIKVLRVYVLYNIGYQLLQRAEVFSPQQMSDGKASMSRLPERFDKLRPAVEGGLQRLKERLKDALLALAPAAAVTTAPARVMIVGAGLGTDPVTGT